MKSVLRDPLEVSTNALSIGEYSVGLAPARCSEQLVAAYLELISIVRRDHPDYLRDEDVDTLTSATGMERAFVANRVKCHIDGVSLAS